MGIMEMVQELEGTAVEHEHGVVASRERAAEALRYGGKATVTVRSRTTEKHVTVELVARQKRENGHGFVPRNTSAGRVGIAEGATCIEARDTLREYPENYVGRLYLDTGEWKAGRDADGLRIWTAEKVLLWALGSYDLEKAAEVFLSCDCSYCGRELTDPQSIEDGVGPECKGKATTSKVAH